MQNIEMDLPDLIEKAQQNLRLLAGLPSGAHFTHPYFGVLNKSHTTKFLTLHTRHHLSIISDILA